MTSRQYGDVELGEVRMAMTGVPCNQTHHKCRSCERTRSVKVRILVWILCKFGLILVIALTSAVMTFSYHRLVPDDNRNWDVGGFSGDGSQLAEENTPSSNQQTQSKEGFPYGGSGEIFTRQHGSLSAARLGLRARPGGDGGVLDLTRDGEHYFTSGDVELDEAYDALIIKSRTTLMLSAEVILSSMEGMGSTSSGLKKPTTVPVCIVLVRGGKESALSCSRTYLRQSDQQLARVWLLFKAEVKDRFSVKTQYPSWVIGKQNEEASVFTVFEVGSLANVAKRAV